MAAARPGMEGSFSSGGAPAAAAGSGMPGGSPAAVVPGSRCLRSLPGQGGPALRGRLPRAGWASASVRGEPAQRRELGGSGSRAVCWAQGEPEEGAGPARALCGGGWCRGKRGVRPLLDRGFALSRPTGAG